MATRTYDDVAMTDTTVYCLRCAGAALTPTDSAESVKFYVCPACTRRYAQTVGGALTERWPGPLGVVLYGVQFESRPQGRAADISSRLAHLDRDIIAAEIRRELAQPSQPVREILPGMPASEADLREYLALVADELERRPPDG